MRKQLCSGVVAAVLWSAPAAAVHTERYQIPYFGLAGAYLVTDSVRDSDDGAGFHASLGLPLDGGVSAVEVRFFDAGFKRFDGKKDYQTGLFVDYVRDFGPLGGRGEAELFGGIKPFLSAGVGFLEEDVRADKHLHLGVSLGGGLLVPILDDGWAVRFDARVQPQQNDESCPSASVCSEAADTLVDYQVNLGLQIPMTLFFDRPVPLEGADCPVAVVDPDTGRRDCAADSDRDGVADAVDQCPGTPAGTAVERTGCAKRVRVESNDADGDGVPDGRDDCPNTQVGLQVDDEGCVVAQNTSIKGVTFLPNAATLTAEGRETLDGLAATLKQQEDLEVEIAGHTDAVGSEAYNTLLSQQRADAVRAYLVQQGIEESRLTAVGYGELEPVASNDTDDGRRANRRVEFRISAD